MFFPSIFLNQESLTKYLVRLFIEGERSVSNRRPPEPQSGALTS